jgi:hypothetical protein
MENQTLDGRTERAEVLKKPKEKSCEGKSSNPFCGRRLIEKDRKYLNWCWMWNQENEKDLISSPYRAKKQPLSSKNSPYRAKLPLSSENPALIQPLSSGSISDIGITCPYRALIQPLSNPYRAEFIILGQPLM